MPPIAIKLGAVDHHMRNAVRLGHHARAAGGQIAHEAGTFGGADFVGIEHHDVRCRTRR